MIKGSVTREHGDNPMGTRGALVLGNGFRCDTLELPWHQNQRGISCTAAGLDRGRVWFSPTLKRLVIRFEDRNGRHDCLIHNGNWAADAVDQDGDGAPEVTQVHGCTEVGRGYGFIERKDGKRQWGITHSGPTVDELVASLRCEPDEPSDTTVDGVGYQDVEIEYLWAAGCEPQS